MSLRNLEMLAEDLDISQLTTKILSNLFDHIRKKRIFYDVCVVELVLLSPQENLALPCICILAH